MEAGIASSLAGVVVTIWLCTKNSTAFSDEQMNVAACTCYYMGSLRMLLMMSISHLQSCLPALLLSCPSLTYVKAIIT